MIVYKATNKINSKVYVGYTLKTLEQRKLNHFIKSKSKSNKHYFYLFKEAIRKYGLESFDWEVLCKCDSMEECCEKEKQFIKELNTISPYGYNLTEGGNGGIPSNETKVKISKTVKKFWKENRNLNSFVTADSTQRADWAKKSWTIKKQKGYKAPSGFTMSKESKVKMSVTKNSKYACLWYNVKTEEIIIASVTTLSKILGISIGTLNHVKNGRQYATKTGWTFDSKLNNVSFEH
jgi:group I intron endonuclease